MEGNIAEAINVASLWMTNPDRVEWSVDNPLEIRENIVNTIVYQGGNSDLKLQIFHAMGLLGTVQLTESVLSYDPNIFIAVLFYNLVFADKSCYTNCLKVSYPYACAHIDRTMYYLDDSDAIDIARTRFYDNIGSKNNDGTFKLCIDDCIVCVASHLGWMMKSTFKPTKWTFTTFLGSIAFCVKMAQKLESEIVDHIGLEGTDDEYKYTCFKKLLNDMMSVASETITHYSSGKVKTEKYRFDDTFSDQDKIDILFGEYVDQAKQRANGKTESDKTYYTQHYLSLVHKKAATSKYASSKEKSLSAASSSSQFDGSSPNYDVIKKNNKFNQKHNKQTSPHRRQNKSYVKKEK